MLTSIQPCEEVSFHHRIQKLTLAIEESRIYWTHMRPNLPAREENRLAFEGRWFGAKSPARILVLMADFRARYATFRSAHAILQRLRSADPQTRQLICHLHLQLADPFYREFTGQWLAERRDVGVMVDVHAVRRFVLARNPRGWSPSTCNQVARKLLAAAAEAGLVTPGPDPRLPTLPTLTDQALGYMLHLLRETTIGKPIFANDYLSSLGLKGLFVQSRLNALPWIRVLSAGNLTTIEWQFDSLGQWAEANL
jgi:hypothetical protein